MIRKITLVFLACLGLQYGAHAQSCGFNKAHNKHLSENPAYAQKVQELNNIAAMEASALEFIQNNMSQIVVQDPNGLGKAYEIPVVIHVMHTGGAIGSIYNPSDAQLIAMINYLNQAFAAMWGPYPDSMSGGTHVPIRFALAQRTENCGITTGIVRMNASASLGPDYLNNGVELSTTNGVDEVDLKNLSRWDNNKYYNIWIVNKIDAEDGTSGSFTAGYAYFPGASATIDGTVMLATQATSGEITLVHELGHAMGLYHTFQSDPNPDGTCADNTDCLTQGDRVCDTDPHLQSPFNCPTASINTCTGLPNGNVVRNFMDYSSCQDRFTAGQRTRMIAQFLAGRRNLIGALAGQPLQATTPAVCSMPPPVTPSAFDIGPRRVRIKDDSYTYLDHNSGGYVGDNNQYYIDNSCHHGAILESGTTDSMYVTVGGTPQNLRVYIDYNADGLFNGTLEQVFAGTGSGTIGFEIDIPTFAQIPQLALCTPLRMRVVSDRTQNAPPTECSMVNGQMEDYTIIVRAAGGGGGGSATVSAALLTNNPSCFGDALTFVATPSTGVNPSFQWFRNGVAIAGATNDTLVTSIPNNNDAIMVRIYYATTCSTDSATSNSITVFRSNAVAPTVTIGITQGSVPNCLDDTLVFSVINAGNPGNNPTYQWQQDGINIPGQTGSTYSGTNIPDGSDITVVMTSNSSCAVPTTAVSNAINVTHAPITPSVSIALTNGNNPGCPGQVLTFTAFPVDAGDPSDITYQWRVNGVNAGPNGPIFTGVFNNNDIVDVILSTTSSCATVSQVFSNNIQIIFTAVTLGVTITNVTGMPICSGRPVSFTSQTTNAGNGPTFQWRINGVNVPGATAANFTSSTLNNGDQVSLVVNSTNICVGNPTAVSNVIIAQIIPSITPSVSLNYLEGHNPGCLDSVFTLEGVVTNLGTNPDGNWFINGVFVGNGMTFTTPSLDSGDVVLFQANQTDGNCYTSDTITVSDTMELYEAPEEPILSLIGNMLFVNNNIYNYYDWYGPPSSLQIPGEHTQWYHPTIPGNYFVFRINVACPSAMSNIINISLLDVKDFELNKIKIYPNPTTGLVNIDWGNEKVDRTIEVFNAVGQSISSETIKGQSHKMLNLSSQANGIYFLVISDAQGNKGTIQITLTK